MCFRVRCTSGRSATLRAVVVEASSKRLLELFPQHGPGRKHERPIVLADWQRAIVDAHPKPFLRGLIHSDGCRTINRFKTRLPSGRVAEYEYPRYFFSNLSADIRGLFCEYCERLGIRWTQSNHRNISVSHRASVAALDAFVGAEAVRRRRPPGGRLGPPEVHEARWPVIASPCRTSRPARSSPVIGSRKSPVAAAWASCIARRNWRWIARSRSRSSRPG